VTPAEIRTAVRTLPDRTILGLTVWGEARGEPPMGQIAVAWVIKNRAIQRRQSIAHVCLARSQFSCWWGDDANATAVRERAYRMLTGEVIADAGWLRTLQMAHQVLVGAVADPTQGSDHYLTTALYQDPHRPAWASTMPVQCIIGRHTFLRESGLSRV
jgi:N-acetylmuramoyl-L-alanine amidase